VEAAEVEERVLVAAEEAVEQGRAVEVAAAAAVEAAVDIGQISGSSMISL
jgi:hypothetical protein